MRHLQGNFQQPPSDLLLQNGRAIAPSVGKQLCCHTVVMPVIIRPEQDTKVQYKRAGRRQTKCHMTTNDLFYDVTLTHYSSGVQVEASIKTPGAESTVSGSGNLVCNS